MIERRIKKQCKFCGSELIGYTFIDGLNVRINCVECGESWIGVRSSDVVQMQKNDTHIKAGKND